MKLLRARIENYRSIQNQAIDFLHGCQVLIGINESGKSNILRALQLLDPSVEIAKADLRIERTNEPQVTGGEVVFTFQLEESEIAPLIKTQANFVEKNSISIPIINGPNGAMNYAQFIAHRADGLYRINLTDGARTTNFWKLNEAIHKIVPGWYRNPTSGILTVSREGKETIDVPPKCFVYLGITEQLPNFEQPTADDVSIVIGGEVRKIIASALPKCIFWRYSDQYLLPSSIDITTFIQNPNSCVPLLSMFELAGYASKDLASTITSARSHSQHRYFQVLRKASDAATKHIRKVWRDHKNVKIDLQPNGELLVPVIVDDEVPLDMASRSDGFKRFVSFLLQISAKVRTKELKNVLLLVDEPEIGLHPGGARSLMHELIEISESNCVVYSTHSIFMVDRENISRHLIVEKKNEITELHTAEKSKIIDEEVLYAAMGYSVFEALREKNIIFEGWRDKEIYRIVCDASCKGDKVLKSELSQIGTTFAEGVKDVKHVARFLELAGRDCLIISDSDPPAIQKKKEYEKKGAWGKWTTLAEILKSPKIATAEDLISRHSIVRRANSFRSKIAGLGAISDSDFGPTESTLSALKRWICNAGIQGDKLDEALDELKSGLFEGLKRDEICAEADEIIAFVRNHDFTATK